MFRTNGSLCRIRWASTSSLVLSQVPETPNWCGGQHRMDCVVLDDVFAHILKPEKVLVFKKQKTSKKFTMHRLVHITCTVQYQQTHSCGVPVYDSWFLCQPTTILDNTEPNMTTLWMSMT